MLILSRRQNEQIRIGNEVIITIYRIQGQAVRVGIDAPAHVNVDREDVYQSKLASGAITRAAPDPVAEASGG